MFEAPSYMPSAVARRSDAAPPFAPLAAIDFRRICSILWQGKFTILLTIVAALVAAALYFFMVPYKYTATTQILV
ncbi:MAG TPA: Wzz/FepE/Etk N-terminal domain-containing protein, partial [Xanthobacteraceae bacterium]|nr:Wzz/FepE/Etk N-terminal domain-containing protein [Xanthobacteraceae bacterium]